MEFILENLLGLFALFIMISSLALQIKFIKFKKKSYPAKALVTDVIKRKLFNVYRLKILLNQTSYQATAFKFKAKTKVGSEVEVIYNPYLISNEDESIVFSKILKKLNLYYFDRPIIYFKNQNPLWFYTGLLLLGFLIASI